MNASEVKKRAHGCRKWADIAGVTVWYSGAESGIYLPDDSYLIPVYIIFL